MGKLGTGCGPSRVSRMGWGTLPDVWDCSANIPGGPGRVGDPWGGPGWVGDPPGGSGWVGGHSERYGTGRGTHGEV